MRLAILGFGREGKSILRFIKNNPQFKGAEIWILDKNLNIKAPAGVKKQLGKNYLKKLERFDIIFRSPGVSYNLPALVRARKKGVEFSSATKLFFEELRRTTQTGRGTTLKDLANPMVIGITGTKGKGTTATLLCEILKAHQEYLQRTARKNSKRRAKKVLLAGNIGKPALDILPELEDGDYAILELSSFQLQDLKSSPKYAVILEIFPDHQDSHANLREYYEAKSNIARHQERGSKIFYFVHDEKSRSAANKSLGRKVAVDTSKFKLFKPSDVKMPGEHNFRNAVMAATIAKELKIPASTIVDVIRGFRGTEHRLEFVRNVAGVAFYNDSASTNPNTAAAAIKAFPHKSKILIAGGQDKKLDYKPLAQALSGSGTSLVVLFGENKEKIAQALTRVKNGKLEIKQVKTLEEAVKLAHENARLGSAVIFSPGAASFDMFKNYADRGEQFKKTVKSLTSK